MITLRITVDVQADHRVILTLPSEVPTGQTELVVTVESPKGKQPLGVPAEAIRGIGAANGPPPDDATVEKWMHERRMEKYG